MANYSCNKCDMSIHAPRCAHCNQEMGPKKLEVEGKQSTVCACPKGCGCIKTPQCCGEDMQCDKK